ncbi:bifunctional serine/threonine-protein kinase/formylglycine-generating enzyme family protein [Oceanicoccus sagamiensis]|uniref:non-specific serine/threonine protein kinase n=1 Tax=Oceanicoccus sagamiensis TaxID=716816 RepID=A0A1X9NG01_9GAMM|nr:bifunctional serine/threonine-protein kinase/formylglycine-generating enzyme family protein [Oceanicoccus sagamiensis]ARN76101.1 hypothetical protein BST96_19565 [Oceanicoccus sagamiensis]
MAIPGYRILRKIRQGGMSTVYLAIQQSVDREVAIKVMSPSLSSDPSFGSRFYREAKIVGQLSHHNIVSIYDVGNHKHYNYIAMDYLPGAPLQDRLDEGVSTEEAIKVVREMASALHYAHEAGYIHRDIKPDNILFRQDGSAVLCDFGIAKALKGNVKMTNFGAVLGTPNYMSPEQAQGKELDGRADIYSLGVVFYEMLTGQVPFNGDDPVAVAVKHMTSPIPKLPSDKKAFQPIIEKMMDKKANARYQTGQEVMTALDELEQSIQSRGADHLTQTGSTTMQVVGIASALVGTLITTISLSIKRLMLTNIKFSNTPVQLSRKQMEDLDTFILDNGDGDLPEELGDMPLIQDTIEQPAIRPRTHWIYWVVAVVSLGLIAFIYLDEQHPDTLREAYIKANHQQITPSSSIEDTIENTDDSLEKTIEAAPTATTVTEEPEVLAAKPKEIINYALTIKTTPSDATIRLLNIKPAYKAGIKLPPGAYHIQVSAEDYFPKKIWLRINNKNISRQVKLKPTRRLLTAGTVINDKLSDGSEGPNMVVLPRLNQAIAISQQEVTFQQYDLFASQTQRSLPKDYDWGRDQRPVVGINYNDAQAYAQWLSEQTGQHYRLPTKEEWQRAAAGGKDTTYWWGDKAQSKMANCKRGCKSQYSKLFSTQTAPVASYAANPYGVYDTAGNVAEWLNGCVEWQDAEGSLCKSALVAGGSHQDTIKLLVSTSTKTTAAGQGSKTVGLRLLLEL